MQEVLVILVAFIYCGYFLLYCFKCEFVCKGVETARAAFGASSHAGDLYCTCYIVYITYLADFIAQRSPFVESCVASRPVEFGVMACVYFGFSTESVDDMCCVESSRTAALIRFSYDVTRLQRWPFSGPSAGQARELNPHRRGVRTSSSRQEPHAFVPVMVSVENEQIRLITAVLCL